MKNSILFLLIIGLILSCHKDEIEPINHTVEYSFFVAGHTYGSPSNYIGGLHPPFVANFPLLNEDSLIEMGFLTGDIVKYSTPHYWDLVDSDLELLKMPVYFAQGNHDATDLPLYNSRYGETYYSFIQNNDLFMVLDGNIDGWRITGDQLTFFKSAIENNKNTVNNVFILTHHLIYSDKYKHTPNSPEGKANELNFMSDLKPILENVNQQVFLIAGDVGAFNYSNSIFYQRDKNIHYIASGMGNGIQENILIFDRYTNGIVKIRVVGLDKSKDSDLGYLVDYE